MTQKIDDGGPAFPCVIGPPSEYSTGLSLRDYFAAKALPSYIMMISDISVKELADIGINLGLSGDVKLAEVAALLSYQQADAMITAGKATKE